MTLHIPPLWSQLFPNNAFTEKYLEEISLEKKADFQHTRNKSCPFVHWEPESAAVSYSKYWWREGKKWGFEYSWKKKIMWDPGQNFLSAPSQLLFGQCRSYKCSPGKLGSLGTIMIKMLTATWHCHYTEVKCIFVVYMVNQKGGMLAVWLCKWMWTHFSSLLTLANEVCY